MKKSGRFLVHSATEAQNEGVLFYQVRVDRTWTSISINNLTDSPINCNIAKKKNYAGGLLVLKRPKVLLLFVPDR